MHLLDDQISIEIFDFCVTCDGFPDCRVGAFVIRKMDLLRRVLMAIVDVLLARAVWIELIGSTGC